MRLTLRFFAFLDVLALLLLGMQVWQVATHYQELSPLLSVKVQALLKFPMFVLILLGAISLFRVKKLGYILYYIQFPFRLYLWIFSVGFIFLLPEAFSNYEDKWIGVLFKCCYVAEFIRLYLTIKFHRTQLVEV